MAACANSCFGQSLRERDRVNREVQWCCHTAVEGRVEGRSTPLGVLAMSRVNPFP